MKRWYIYFLLFFFGSMHTGYAMDMQTSENVAIEEQKSNGLFEKNGLFIFLDDSETHLEFVLLGFLRAMLEKAGPMLVSASIIVNARDSSNPIEEKDPQKIVDRFNELTNKYGQLTIEEKIEVKDIILLLAAFNEQKAQDWIIKEVTNELYLLLPKEYLKSRNIKPEEIALFTKDAQLTDNELALGLKVNHMRTVKVSDIKQSRCFFISLLEKLNQPIYVNPLDYCNYFINAVWNTQNEESLIFVTNKEYTQYNKKPLPWSIIMTGHGMVHSYIAGIPIQDFKQFLAFIEKKINMTLLYYESCYAAGLNNAVIYKDSKQALYKTYPFIIITQALTDVVVRTSILEIDIEDGVLKLENLADYTGLFKEMTNKDYVDYYKVGMLLSPEMDYSFKLIPLGYLGSLLPQVKLPGVEWFSVIEAEKGVSIGNVMAKHRKRPLHIATYFAKKGQKANPLAILLYAANIPFELIINTENLPSIVSMIPGKAEHTIKKISSQTKTVDAILNSFFEIMSYYDPTKSFKIDEITALNSPVMQKTLSIDDSIKTITLKNVYILSQLQHSPSPRKYLISFDFNNSKYVIEEKELTIDSVVKVEEIKEEEVKSN